MAINETKMQMVIANYFKDECDVNTSIRQAFEKGFRIGVEKGASTNRPQGKWIFDPEILCSDIGVYSAGYRCSVCGKDYFKVDRMNYCPFCGARMKGADDE